MYVSLMTTMFFRKKGNRSNDSTSLYAYYTIFANLSINLSTRTRWHLFRKYMILRSPLGNGNNLGKEQNNYNRTAYS